MGQSSKHRSRKAKKEKVSVVSAQSVASNGNTKSVKSEAPPTKEPPSTAQSDAPGGLSFVMLFGGLLVAMTSFGIGVFTPPLLSLQKLYLDTGSQENEVYEVVTEHRFARTSNYDGPRNECTPELLEDFLHEEPVPGMHIICMSASFTANVFRGSVGGRDIHKIGFSGGTWDEMKDALNDLLELQVRPFKNQAWALFNQVGVRLVDEDQTGPMPEVMNRFSKEGLLILIEGGQWVWPGVAKGFKRIVDLSHVPGGPSTLEPRNATIETISLYPLVLSVQGFLSETECNLIQEEASPHMRYSGVSLMDKDKGRPASDFRTSQSTFLASTNPILKEVDVRTASLVRIPVRHQEHVQVLRYGYTEKYDAHHDFFDPQHYQNDPHTLRTIAYGKRNRMATVFWYLTDVAKGGETIFPRYDGAQRPRNMADCKSGLKVKPQRGKVIIFYSMTPDGALDDLSLHAACPVEEGIKWAANKWVWSSPLKV